MFARRPGRHRPDQVVAMHRNAWSPSLECALRAGRAPSPHCEGQWGEGKGPRHRTRPRDFFAFSLRHFGVGRRWPTGRMRGRGLLESWAAPHPPPILFAPARGAGTFSPLQEQWGEGKKSRHRAGGQIVSLLPTPLRRGEKVADRPDEGQPLVRMLGCPSSALRAPSPHAGSGLGRRETLEC